MKSSTKKWIAAGSLVTAGAAAGAAAHLVTKYLMDMALDRTRPKSLMDGEKSRQMIRGSAYQEQFLRDLEAAAEKLKNEHTQRVEITARDGVTLVGHLRRAEHPRRVILAMHGWRSSWDQDFGMIADFWHSQGCTVLYAEQRGQNESGGDYMGFGMLERYDAVEWARWISQHSDLPIYLAGVSMGASTVLMAAGLDLPPQVKGIAADCGYTSAQEIWKHITNENLHMSYGIHRFDIEDLCRKKIQLSPSDCTTTDALRHTKIPVLLVHGTDDSFVPVEMTYENYKACAGPRTLLIVPGADHGMSYYVDKAQYEKVAADFFAQCESSR